VYTACSSRLTSSELQYVVDDCSAKVFITSLYKAEQAAQIVAETPGVAVRLMLDGTVPGYESYEDAVAAPLPEPLDEQRVAGTDMLYSVGTTGRPKGDHAPVRAAAAWRPQPNRVAPLLQMLFGGTSRQHLPVPRALLPRCSRCGSRSPRR
jgi:acyl-coenzyme A synthetase/AMP-(fatty) acid ligase